MGTGKVFSNSVLDARSNDKAVSILQKALGEISHDFSIDEQVDPKNNIRIILKEQSNPLEKLSEYSPKTYILSRRRLIERENTRRTDLWFTSPFRN